MTATCGRTGGMVFMGGKTVIAISDKIFCSIVILKAFLSETARLIYCRTKR
jgi:hypothetical protein